MSVAPNFMVVDMGKKKTTSNPQTSKAKKTSPTKKKQATKSGQTKRKTDASAAPNESGRIADTTFLVVGLGASAGGLEALEEFFEAIPADSGMAFIVVMHQAAKHVSLLPELLDKCTTISVVPIVDQMAIEPNHAYVVPPGKNVDSLNGRLHLTDLPARHAAPLPIDHFFRSLAMDRREMAVGIVLSGTGTDGTAGLASIKGEAGMAMAQSIESAKFSGMPQNAIDAGMADYVLSPGEMPAKLIAYGRGPCLKPPPSSSQPAPAIRLAVPEVLLKLRRRCGHDFSAYKTSTICRRIERRLNVHQITDPKQYIRLLDENEQEADVLFRDLLIGVTSFFRDSFAWEALAQKAIIPRLKEKNEDAPFRVWVPGCSTGEEAYSIAILLRECMDELKIHSNVQIFATDLDDRAIAAARVGLFPDSISGDISNQRLNQFFIKEDSSYRVRMDVRDWLIFAPQNVIHDPPFTRLDLISCRNMLIYMQAELQKKLLMLFHYSLAPGGCLFLGTSELISEFDDLYQSLDNKAKVFRRKEPPSRLHRRVQFPVIGSSAEKTESVEKPKELTAGALRDTITQMLAAEFAPPTVVITKSGEIVHVHGRTGMFLELAPGSPTRNIASLAREGLELDLSSALRKVWRQQGPVVHENVPVKTNGDSVLINLIVQKLTEPQSLRGLVRISFQLLGEVTPPTGELPPGSKLPKPSQRRSTHEKDLERALQTTRESLQQTIEELDASNEEMKSSNEELQSTNEELQSTNEELETSKEELQSLNEELQTVNAEFQSKIAELSTANDDMNNLLNSTDIATIFLDNQFNIKRYTEQLSRIFRVIPSDVGRSLRDLTSHLRYDSLIADASEVLKTLVPKECEVQTDDGRWLLMRILPYRTSDDRIDGLVMTFVDVAALRLAQEARGLGDSLIDAAPLLISCLDLDGRFVFTNSAYEELIGRSRNELLGVHFREVIGDEAYQIGAAHFKAALHGELRQFECQLPLRDGGFYQALMQFIPRRDSEDIITGVFVMVTNTESLHVAQIERALFEGIVETVREPLLVLDGQMRVNRANRAFYDTFQVSPEQTKDRLLFELGDGQWDIPALHELLENILPKNTAFDNFEVQHDFPEIGTKRLLLNARRIATSPGQPSLILLAMAEASSPPIAPPSPICAKNFLSRRRVAAGGILLLLSFTISAACEYQFPNCSAIYPVNPREAVGSFVRSRNSAIGPAPLAH